MNKPVLSICIPVYNHEKYIVECLDSVFMQKLDYPYEVLVGEDCSKDQTRKVLMQYEMDHNYSFLHVIYREHNINNEEVNNSRDLILRAQGKYIIVLEGDDYWIDCHKLRKQIDFLEKNPDYIAVAHSCVVVDKHSEITNEQYPSCRETEYTFGHFANAIMPGQTATLMMRNFAKDENVDKSLWLWKHPIGDRKLVFTLLNHGRIYCMQEPMSAYRHIVNEGSSFSAQKTGYQFEKGLALCNQYIRYAKTKGNKKAFLAAELLYWKCVRGAVKEKVIRKNEGIRYIQETDYKARIFFDLLISDMINLICGKSRKPVIL